ncbi:MAG: hypothetical protein J6T15_01645 [Bacilli bacterium]|nr:hypothetical protein [Bacilli bacterium]
MNEEKRVNGKDVIRLLLGNKWLYLVLVGVFFVTSFVGLSLFSSSRKEYVAFFDYDVAGFNTVVSENGEKNSYYIDGEKFDPRAIVTKEKISGYIQNNNYLSGLDAEKMSQRNLVTSFSYKTRYKANDHKMDDKDSAYVEDQKGYELVLDSYGLNDFQAKVLCECIADEVISVSKNKIDKIHYSSYITAYDKAKSYPDKINNLVSGIENLTKLSETLKETYGDVLLPSGNYGGDEGYYYLDQFTISSWQNQMRLAFDSYYVNSLSNELEVNGYIVPESKEYIESLRSTVESLNRQIAVNNGVLIELKNQRDGLVRSVGSSEGGSSTNTNATVESLEIREYNTEIIALTKQIAEDTERVNLYKLQLDKLNTSSLTPEYNSNLEAFESKLTNIRADLEFYTNQYEAIAKKIMIDNLNVYFDSEEIVTARGEFDFSIIFVGSVAIGILAPMLVNLILAGFNLAEGKSLLNLKKRKNSDIE